MASEIDTVTKRRKLKARREPYWHKLAKGQYLGYRKRPTAGTWVARIRTEQGQKHNGIDADDFETASDEARKWFARVLEMPAHNSKYTVVQAVSDYVKHLEVNNGKDSATRSRQMLEKHLVPVLGKVELSKLTTIQLKSWLDGLVNTEDAEKARKSKDTANRILSSVKAAFNLVYNNGVVQSDAAWKRVKAFRDVGQARTLFLTDDQVGRVLEKTSGSFHLLIKAAVLTGARYGELASALVCDLDVINGSLRLDGKTGARDCYLSSDALTFFKQVSRDRLPDAYLLARDDGTPWGKSYQNRPMKEAVRAARLPQDAVFYSLRHYHISKALLAGIPAQVIAENCGTSTRMIERHYGKFMKADRRAMMNQVVLNGGTI